MSNSISKSSVEPEYIALSIDGNQTDFKSESEMEEYLFNHIMGCLEDVYDATDAYRDYIGIYGIEGDEEERILRNAVHEMIYYGWSHLDEGNPDDNGNLIYSAEITNDIEAKALGDIFYIEVYKDEYNGGMKKSLDWDTPVQSEGPSGQTVRTTTAEISRNSTTYVLSASEEYDGDELVMCWAKVYDAIRNECVAGDLCPTLNDAKDKCEILLERYLDNPDVQYGASLHKFIIGKRLAKMSSLINVRKSGEFTEAIDDALVSMFPVGNLYDIRELQGGEFAIYFGPLFDTKYIANELKNNYGLDARAVGYEVAVNSLDYSASTHKMKKSDGADADTILSWVHQLAQSQGSYGRLLNQLENDPEALQNLVDQGFKDPLDMILYLEG